MENVYDVAMNYARKGLKVVPIALGKKNPILSNWVNEASTNPATLKTWFEGKDTNIGIVTGKTSNIIVIDLDIGEDGDGAHSLAEMEMKMGSYLPETVTSRTQSGGTHLWFKYPSGVERITGKIGILPHVDIRADGNQVVVYPSVGSKGSYEWIKSPMDTPIATLPKAWKQFICGEFEIEGMAKIRIPKKAFVLPEVIPSGVRHSRLLSYACSLSNKKMSAVELAGAVREANRTRCNPPISNEDEINKIIEFAVDQIGKSDISVPEGTPEWVMISEKGQYSIDDGLFIKEYKNDNELVCINGMFYKVDGQVDNLFIKQDIQSKITPYVVTSLSNKVNNLYDALKNECYIPQPEPVKNVIHTATQSLKVDDNGVFEIETGFTLNRLDVKYNINAKCPLWKMFLTSLLEEEDILTLQEYIGYCLVPTTLAQKALFLIGRGGEGKSVVGEVLHGLFRNSMVQGELHHLQDNRFMLAQLENKLVFYDDDLQTSALTDTGTFKKIVTANIPVLVERKGEPHYEMQPYARIIASGNKGIEACYDHSDGFYRRLIVLKCKGKEHDRKDDRLLAKKIIDTELSGLFNWALEGLMRLMGDNWTFSMSKNALDNLKQAEEEGNNFLSFLSDKSITVYDDKADATSNEIYNAYTRWCELNALKPMGMRTIGSFMRDNADQYGVTYSTHILRGSQNRRGFKGIGILDDAKQPTVGRFKIVAGGK